MRSVRGTIRRRILVNFRVSPDVARRRLPDGWEPKLVGGHALAGVCLIRLERERPSALPGPFGLSSENAAHRFAAYRIDERGRREECVYIARRHSGSPVNVMLGGRVFPGEQHPARFAIREGAGVIDLAMSTSDAFDVRLRARRATALPPRSVFTSIEEASRFFRGGALGYSATSAGDYVDALYMEAARWHVVPLDVALVRSTYFDDPTLFPPRAIEFDSALLMEDVDHAWRPMARVAVTGRDRAATR